MSKDQGVPANGEPKALQNGGQELTSGHRKKRGSGSTKNEEHVKRRRRQLDKTHHSRVAKKGKQRMPVWGSTTDLRQFGREQLKRRARLRTVTPREEESEKSREFVKKRKGHQNN